MATVVVLDMSNVLSVVDMDSFWTMTIMKIDRFLFDVH